MDANEVLKSLIEQGIVSSDSLRQVELMNLEKKVLLVHEYKIYQLPNGQWKTYLPLPTGRKEIRAKSKEVILNKVLEFYEKDESSNLDNLTFSKLFDEWLEYKTTITESPNTIKRHVQHYNKYFRVFGSGKISSFDYLSLQTLCNSIVKEHNMTSKEWVNVKTVLKGMFEYAYEKGYIAENPLPRVKISVRFRQENRKTGTTEVFNSDEYNRLVSWLDERYAESLDSTFLAIKVNFYLGLRVGELVALKWSDIEDQNLHVVREEIRNQSSGEFFVVEHTKTSRDRFLPIISDAMAIFYKIYKKDKPNPDDFIFRRGTTRITMRQIDYALRKYSRSKNIIMKSSHKIRKTYASKLEANGVPVDEIRQLLGHTNLDTTMKYLYNPLTSEETRLMVEDALSSNYPQI